MSQSDTPSTTDDDVPLQYSPLERKVERDGVWVKICIYRGEGDPGWLLEVEDHRGGSTVWDDPFETDQAALDQALRSIDEDGIESFAQASTYVDLLPMLALAGITAMDKIAELNPATAADPEAWPQKAREELPDTVATLYNGWSDGRRVTAELLADRASPVRRAVGKAERNDPCPCGSGKKFRKCHAS